MSNRCYLLHFHWVFSSVLTDILLNQTEKFWNCLGILLLAYLAPELQKQALDVFCKERCSSKFWKFTGKHLRQSLFVNKVTGLRPAILLKKRLWYRYFPVNFAKFPRTAFSQNTSWQLLLNLEGCVMKVSISASTVALFSQKKILKKGLYLLKSLVNWVFNLWKNIQTPCPSAPVIDHQILHQGLKRNSKNSVGKFKKIKLTWVSQFFTGGLNKASQIFT